MRVPEGAKGAQGAQGAEGAQKGSRRSRKHEGAQEGSKRRSAIGIGIFHCLSTSRPQTDMGIAVIYNTAHNNL